MKIYNNLIIIKYKFKIKFKFKKYINKLKDLRLNI